MKYFCFLTGAVVLAQTVGVSAWAVQPTKAPALEMVSVATPADDQGHVANINHLFFNRVSQSLEFHADQPIVGALGKDVLPDGRVYWRVTINRARWGLTLPSQAQLKTEINRVLPQVDLVHYKTLPNNTVQLVLSLPPEITPAVAMSGSELTLSLMPARPLATVKPTQLMTRIPVLTPMPPKKLPDSSSVTRPASAGSAVLNPAWGRITAAGNSASIRGVNVTPVQKPGPTMPLIPGRQTSPPAYGVDTVTLQQTIRRLEALTQRQDIQLRQQQQQLAQTMARLSQTEQALQQAQQAASQRQVTGDQAARQMQAEKTALQTQLAQIKADSQALQAQLSQAKAQQQTVQTQLAEARQQTATRQGDQQKQLQQLTQDRDALKKALAELQQQHAVNLAKTDALTRQLASQTATKDTTASKQLAMLQTQLEQAQASLTAEKAAQASTQQTAARLQAELDQAKKQLTQQQAMPNPLSKPNDAVQANELARLKTQLQQALQGNAQLTQRVQTLEQQKAEPSVALETPPPAVTRREAETTQNTARNALDVGTKPVSRPTLPVVARSVAKPEAKAPAKTPLASKPAVKPVIAASNSKPVTPSSGKGSATADKRWQQALSETDANRASRLLTALIKDYPHDFEPVKQLADSQSGQGDWAQAVKTLQGYLTLHPDSQQAFQAIGSVYLKAERWADAKLAFGRVTDTQPVLDYGLQLKQAQKLPLAEATLKLATELDPVDATRQFHLGNVYSAEQKLPEAKNAYLQAIALRDHFAEASYNLGIILSKLGDQEGAIARLENYLEWSPNATNTQAVQAYIDRLKASRASSSAINQSR